MKEIWDAYYRDRTLANIDLVRGEDIPEDLKKWQPELEKEFKTIEDYSSKFAILELVNTPTMTDKEI